MNVFKLLNLARTRVLLFVFVVGLFYSVEYTIRNCKHSVLIKWTNNVRFNEIKLMKQVKEFSCGEFSMESQSVSQ